MNRLIQGIHNLKANLYKKNRTAYFYWEIKNGQRTGALISTDKFESVIPSICYPEKNDSPLKLEDCSYFSVDYDWYNREIFLTYYFPVFNDLENADDFDMDSRTLVLCVMEGDIGGILQKSENQENVETAFGFNLPSPVMKCAIKEIRRMQKGAFSHVPKIKISQFNYESMLACLKTFSL